MDLIACFNYINKLREEKTYLRGFRSGKAQLNMQQLAREVQFQL